MNFILRGPLYLMGAVKENSILHLFLAVLFMALEHRLGYGEQVEDKGPGTVEWA